MEKEKQSPLEKAFTVELSLLKAMAIREHYENYIDYVVYERLIEETRVFLDAYKYYFDLYTEHKEIDFDTFLTQFTSNWHAKDMHEEQINFYSQAIKKVKLSSMDDAEAALIGLINLQLEQKFKTIMQKPFDSEILRTELDNYDIKRAGIIREYDRDAFKASMVDFSEIDKSLGVPFALSPLQLALGGMVKGSLIVLNAASGIGKSAFLHTQIVHTLKWLIRTKSTRPILFFNTEGPSSEVYGRCWSNLYQKQITGGYREIMKMRDKVQRNFIRTFTDDLFVVYKANNMGINYIRMKIAKHNPCLVILDMAPAIAGFQGKNVSDTKGLETYFNTLRDISSSNCPIMATVQAGNGAKWWDKNQHKYLYKQWPTDDDIYGSKTAVQGAAETIITIGRDNEHEFDRFVQTTKLKSDCDPARFKCEIVRKFSNYEFIHNMSGFGE